MSELDEAIARLERAVARLDAAVDPAMRTVADERLASVAEAIGRHVDAALARLDRLLEAEE